MSGKCDCLKKADLLIEGAKNAQAAGDMEAFVELISVAAQYVYLAKQIDRARATLKAGEMV